MGWNGPDSERKRRIALVVGLVLCVAVVVVAYLHRPRPTDHVSGPPDASSGSHATGDGHGHGDRRGQDGRKAMGRALLRSHPRLGHPGSAAGAEKHHLTITVSSTERIGLVAYIIPTSREYERGRQTVTGTTWSLSTTVYGSPAYAGVFAQSSIDANPVTCEIEVDGRVTARRTTHGQFAAEWCRG